MTLQEQFKGIIDPNSLTYIYDRLTAVVGDFFEADKEVEAAYLNKAELVKRRVELETEIKLDESEAFMAIQGEGKTAYAMVGDQRIVLGNEQARDAYRRMSSKEKRIELSQVDAQIAQIDINIMKAKDRYKANADAADSLKATASVQAALLGVIGKVN